MRGGQSTCFACKLSWQQPSFRNPREQQGAQSHPRKARDCPMTGTSQSWPGPAAAGAMRLRGETGLCPSPHKAASVLPSDPGVVSGEKWGRCKSRGGQCLGFPEAEGAGPPGSSLPCRWRSRSSQDGKRGSLGEESSRPACRRAGREPGTAGSAPLSGSGWVFLVLRPQGL